jgi:Niemann-Pick C1 N terminus
VDEIDLFVTEEYFQGTFQSCKNVLMPQTGKRVIELMGCGDWGASKCSAQQWFGFMGNVTSAELV